MLAQARPGTLERRAPRGPGRSPVRKGGSVTQPVGSLFLGPAGWGPEQLDPGDRRRIHLELTETGREAGNTVRAELTELFQCGLARLDDEQMDTLHRGLALLDGVIGDLEAKGFAPAKH